MRIQHLLTRSLVLPSAAAFLLALASTAPAQISLGGYVFDDNAGPEIATSYGGDSWFRGNTTPSCGTADLMPGTTTDDQGLQAVMTSNNFEHWVQGIARIELTFTDNRIANGPGADFVVFELGGREAFDVQVFNPITNAFTAARTYTPSSTGLTQKYTCFTLGYNASAIDLADFGIASDTLISRIRISNRSNRAGCCAGADILPAFALNSYTDVIPVADAGLDQLAFTEATVNLDGNLSTDDLTTTSNLLYAWTISSAPAGSTAGLTNGNTATPSFVPDKAGVYTISLVVTDNVGQASAADEMTVTASIPNAKPTADAGADGTGPTNVTASLDGTASSDPDNDSLTYAWTLVTAPAGSAASLVNSTTSTPTLTPDVPGSYVMQLVVNDGLVDSDPASVEFEAVDAKIFAESKVGDVSAYVSGLPLENFFQGDHDRPTSQKHKDKHAKKAKRKMLRYLKHAARDVRKIGHDSRHHRHANAAHLARHKKHTLRTLSRAIERSDGVSLRSAPDGKSRRSGFRHDLIIGTTAATTVFGCLTKAAEAVAAIE